jgi:hypothetical protein
MLYWESLIDLTTPAREVLYHWAASLPCDGSETGSQLQMESIPTSVVSRREVASRYTHINEHICIHIKPRVQVQLLVPPHTAWESPARREQSTQLHGSFQFPLGGWLTLRLFPFRNDPLSQTLQMTNSSSLPCVYWVPCSRHTIINTLIKTILLTSRHK